jgi:hypothetical protein
MGYLVFPTTAVRGSYLDGERAMCSRSTAGHLVGGRRAQWAGSATAAPYHLSRRVLCEVEVLAMTLWDEVGGRTWIERAGPRSAIKHGDARPSRPRRVRRVRHAVPAPVAPRRQAASTPARRAAEGPT